MIIYLNPLILNIDLEVQETPYLKEILIAGITKTVPIAICCFHTYYVIFNYYKGMETDSIPKIILNTFSIPIDVLGYTFVVRRIVDAIDDAIKERIGD